MNRQSNELTVQREVSKFLLNALSVVANKNATTLCRGLLYEPKVPRKLKDN